MLLSNWCVSSLDLLVKKFLIVALAITSACFRPCNVRILSLIFPGNRIPTTVAHTVPLVTSAFVQTFALKHGSARFARSLQTIIVSLVTATTAEGTSEAGKFKPHCCICVFLLWASPETTDFYINSSAATCAAEEASCFSVFNFKSNWKVSSLFIIVWIPQRNLWLIIVSPCYFQSGFAENPGKQQTTIQKPPTK